MTRTSNFADVIRQKLAKDPQLASGVEDATFELRLASEIYEARTKAGLTQQQLADLAGTSQSVIARLEDADYDGHSLKLLRRLAEAMGLVVRVELFAKPRHTLSAASVGQKSVQEVEWPPVESQKAEWDLTVSVVAGVNP